MTLRIILFYVVLSGGTTILEKLELLPGDEAFLVAGGIGALLLFVIPDEQKRRDLGLMNSMLLYIFVVYGVYFKFQAWLAMRIDPLFATGICVSLFVLFIASVFMRRRQRTQTPSP